MLGNNADAFFTKPMPTTVVTQAGTPRPEMPAPRETARVGQNEMLPGMGEEPRAMYPRQQHAEMLPGMGNGEMLPGMGNGEMLPGMGNLADAAKNPWVWLGAGGLLWAFGTEGGKKFRKRIGIA